MSRLYRELLDGRFRFDPGVGVPQKRPGKRPRPIVVQSIRNRVVQRSILDVLEELPAIGPVLDSPGSFGGLPGRGLREAIEAVHSSIAGGAQSYVRTDIKDFFANIPRQRVLASLDSLVRDSDFMELCSEAVATELDNLAQLGEDADLFPTYELGVAQGCCLSPLLGNLLLLEFDRAMTGQGIHCVRYIDDLVLLGASDRSVHRALRSASRRLESLGLEIYSPGDGSGKATEGSVGAGFEFLGCRVLPQEIRPSRSSWQRIKKRIKDELDESVGSFRDPAGPPPGLGLVPTLRRASNLSQGWGNQYSFCNCPNWFSQLDGELDRLLKDYIGRYAEARRKAESGQGAQQRSRRLLGFHLLTESRTNPIISH